MSRRRPVGHDSSDAVGRRFDDVHFVFQASTDPNLVVRIDDDGAHTIEFLDECQAALRTQALPAGEYVLRMAVRSGGTTVLTVSRSFRVPGPPIGGGAP